MGEKVSPQKKFEDSQRKKIFLAPQSKNPTSLPVFIIRLIFHFTPALFEIYILSFLVEELDQIGDHNLKHELEKYNFFIVNIYFLYWYMYFETKKLFVFVVVFLAWKNPQFNFSCQNLSSEHDYF